MVDLNLSLRVVNIAVTLGIAIFLARRLVRRETRTAPLILWSASFVVWSTSLLMLFWFPLATPQISIMHLVIQFLFLLGTSMLFEKQALVMSAFIPFMALMWGTVSWWGAESPLAILMLVGAFGTNGVLFFLIRSRLPNIARWLVSGWALILAANIIYFVVPVFVADAVSIVGKVFLGIGMNSPVFAYTRWIRPVTGYRLMESPRKVGPTGLSPAESALLKDETSSLDYRDLHNLVERYMITLETRESTQDVLNGVSEHLYSSFAKFATEKWGAGETDLSLILDMFYRQVLRLKCDSSDAAFRKSITEEFFRIATKPAHREDRGQRR